MDYRTLKYIMTVAEEKSISKAAKKLFITQPSLSHCVLKQEKLIGVPLFDRTRQPLQLTYAGERYIAAASHILGEKERLEKELQDIANAKKGRVILGLTKPRSVYLIPNVFPRYKIFYPNVEVVLIEEINSTLESLLLAGKIDIAILMMPCKNEFFSYTHLYDEEVLLCVPDGHWAIEEFLNNGVDISLLKNEPFILYKTEQQLRKISDKLFAAVGFTPNVVLESQMAETILRLVSARAGCAFLPRSVTQYTSAEPSPTFFKIGHPPMSSGFAFAWVKDSYVNWAAQEFIKLTKEFVEEEREQVYEMEKITGQNDARRKIIYTPAKTIFRPE